MGLESVRARLKDRQHKEGALGTAEVTICLEPGLVDQLERLEDDLVTAERQREAESGKPRLGSKGDDEPAEIVEMRARVESLKGDVRASQLRLVFRSLASATYQEIVNINPDLNRDEQAQAVFMNALCSRALSEVWESDTAGDETRLEGLGWAEIAESTNPGEWLRVTGDVYALQMRKVDIPFSARPSQKMRS